LNIQHNAIAFPTLQEFAEHAEHPGSFMAALRVSAGFWKDGEIPRFQPTAPERSAHHQVAFRGANSPNLPNNNVSPQHPRDRERLWDRSPGTRT